MASPGGSGSDISRQEASDLLNKLVTEKTKVQAVFVGISSLGAGLIGFLFASRDGTVVVKSNLEVDGPFLRFDPRPAVSFKYGDTRALPDARVTSQSLSVASALVLIYPDKTLVSLFEIPSDSGT
jgi:hypothetical protein